MKIAIANNNDQSPQTAPLMGSDGKVNPSDLYFSVQYDLRMNWFLANSEILIHTVADKIGKITFLKFIIFYSFSGVYKCQRKRTKVSITGAGRLKIERFSLHDRSTVKKKSRPWRPLIVWIPGSSCRGLITPLGRVRSIYVHLLYWKRTVFEVIRIYIPVNIKYLGYWSFYWNKWVSLSVQSLFPSQTPPYVQKCITNCPAQF